MPPKFGVDYAWGNPGVKALKEAGVRFVCRYLSHDSGKDLRAAEAKVLRASGIDLVTVWETTANRALAGRAAGIEDARDVVVELRELGAPKDAPCYFAVDFDANPQEQRAINAYLKGCADVLGKDRVGVYGGLWVVKRALDAGVCRYAWQTYAWSGGAWDPRAHIQQYDNGNRINGVPVDYDRAMQPDFGQWDRPWKEQRKPVKVKWVKALVPRWVAVKWAKRRAKKAA